MILYEYQMRFPTMQVKEIEAEEKPQSYSTIASHSRILKSEIGKVKESWRFTIYLLEKDFEKAKALFLEHMNKEYAIQLADIEREQRNLSKYKDKIKQFSELKESDVIEWR